MHLHKVLFGAAVVALGIGAAATSAAADPYPTLASCIKLGHQLRQALDSHPSSPNLDNARREGMSARDFCSSGVYEKGVGAYEQALQMLRDSDAGPQAKN